MRNKRSQYEFSAYFEDEIELSDLIAGQVRELGVNVETTDTAEEALEMMSTCDYVLVISDIRLPGIDGLQMIKKVLDSNGHHPVFYVMSGFSDYSMEQILEAGARRFYEKPGGLIDLINELQNFFSE